MIYEQYRAAWDNAPTITPNIPMNVDIELSAACNLKCPFCFLQNKAYNHKPSFMLANLAMDIIDEAKAAGIPAVKMNWRGEPTIHPMFSSIMEYAKSAGFLDILINTNGNFKEPAIDGLMCATKVIVSVDSMEQLTYHKMRPGGNLMRVLNNVTRLLEAGHGNVWIRRVVTEDNRAEDFVGLVRAAFGNLVKISEHGVFERGRDTTKPTRRAYCGYPSQRLVIAHNGDIFPCCVDYFQTLKLGNIKTDTLCSIWNGAKLEQLRQGLKTGERYPGQCADCRSWMGYADKRRELVADKEITA